MKSTKLITRQQGSKKHLKPPSESQKWCCFRIGYCVNKWCGFSAGYCVNKWCGFRIGYCVNKWCGFRVDYCVNKWCCFRIGYCVNKWCGFRISYCVNKLCGFRIGTELLCLPFRSIRVILKLFLQVHVLWNDHIFTWSLPDKVAIDWLVFYPNFSSISAISLHALSCEMTLWVLGTTIKLVGSVLFSKYFAFLFQ